MADATLIYNLLKEIFFLIDDGDRHLFSQYNLSVPRFYILWHLGNEPGISSQRLSELMICDKSNITRLSKGLEADGLVVRQPHESDGRALRLYLTEMGEAVREQSLATHLAYNDQRFSDCSVEGQDSLQQQLLCLKDSLLTQLTDFVRAENG
ncbi:MAG: MarR family transcriptional regulator [Anaerolineae bacterium]|nr:MarR family transcriptional regulator [Anaerolineae bacterium]